MVFVHHRLSVCPTTISLKDILNSQMDTNQMAEMIFGLSSFKVVKNIPFHAKLWLP